jgi:hypothetical protein
MLKVQSHPKIILTANVNKTNILVVNDVDDVGTLPLMLMRLLAKVMDQNHLAIMNQTTKMMMP